jgi:hypothetical protein
MSTLRECGGQVCRRAAIAALTTVNFIKRSPGPDLSGAAKFQKDGDGRAGGHVPPPSSSAATRGLCGRTSSFQPGAANAEEGDRRQE